MNYFLLYLLLPWPRANCTSQQQSKEDEQNKQTGNFFRREEKENQRQSIPRKERSSWTDWTSCFLWQCIVIVNAILWYLACEQFQFPHLLPANFKEAFSHYTGQGLISVFNHRHHYQYHHTVHVVDRILPSPADVYITVCHENKKGKTPLICSNESIHRICWHSKNSNSKFKIWRAFLEFLGPRLGRYPSLEVQTQGH